MYTQLMLNCSFNALKLSSKIWSSPYSSSTENQTFWISRNLFRLIFWHFSNFVLIPIQFLYCIFELVKNFTQIKQTPCLWFFEWNIWVSPFIFICYDVDDSCFQPSYVPSDERVLYYPQWRNTCWCVFHA